MSALRSACCQAASFFLPLTRLLSHSTCKNVGVTVRALSCDTYPWHVGQNTLAPPPLPLTLWLFSLLLWLKFPNAVPLPVLCEAVTSLSPVPPQAVTAQGSAWQDRAQSVSQKIEIFFLQCKYNTSIPYKINNF